VLVPAAIIAYSTSLQKSIKHQFHDECVELFNYLDKQPGVGIGTSRVARESNNALVGAFETTLRSEINDSRAAFEVYSINLSRCQERLKKLIQSLSLEKVDEDDDWYALYMDVAYMYKEISNLYIPPEKMKREVARLSRFDSIPGRSKSVIFRLRKEELMRRNESIRRLHRKFPSDRDQMILADAAWLQKKYRSDSQLLLASCDTGAFVPTYGKGVSGWA